MWKIIFVYFFIHVFNEVMKSSENYILKQTHLTLFSSSIIPSPFILFVEKNNLEAGPHFSDFFSCILCHSPMYYSQMPKKHVQRSGIRSKKGESGGKTVQYITRSRAVTKLQITLRDFRQLCILKGIFPRNPPKATKGKDKTYYHLKDILFLQHEPLLQKFREMKIFLRKKTRLERRYEHDSAKDLESRRPVFNLDHLVKERYPTFLDAIRDYDDPLSTLFLFQSLKAHISKTYTHERVSMVERLCDEWIHYVQTTRSLRKVFVSIKGYYFQADVKGNPVTWLLPHRIMQNVPREIDYKIMTTFLQFYETFGRFVHFKLFKDEKMVYPPVFTADDEANAAKALFTVSSKEKALKKAANKTAKLAKQGKVQSLKASAAATSADAAADADDSEVEKDDNDFEKFHKIDADSLPLLNEDANKVRSLFEKKVFLVSREVPFLPTSFVIRCAGGVAVSELDITPEQAQSPLFTHQIIDRPSLSSFLPSRQYIQPQWVFDCFNERFVLPIAPYAPGQALPPHLSPFVDDAKEGYVPDQRNQLRMWAGSAPLVVNNVEAPTMTEAEKQRLEEEAEEAEYQKGLRQEVKALKKAVKAESEEINAQFSDDDNDDDDNNNDDDEDVEIIGDSDDEEEVSDDGESSEEEEAPAKPVRPAAFNSRDNDRELAKMVMKKKDARRLGRMEFGIERRKQKGALLAAKRKAIETGEDMPLPKKRSLY